MGAYQEAFLPRRTWSCTKEPTSDLFFWGRGGFPIGSITVRLQSRHERHHRIGSWRASSREVRIIADGSWRAGGTAGMRSGWGTGFIPPLRGA
ncbi:MAG: hypothetical protein RIS70_90 [Planctomycetota bacterium]